MTHFIQTICERIRGKNDGVVRWWPIAFVTVACVGFGFGIMGLEKSNRYPTVTEHHVKVLSRVSPNQWAMESDEEGKFLYAGCPDFPNETVIWVGFIADHARWEEQGHCKSIRGTGLGFWWDRDSDFNAKGIQ